MKNRTKKRLLTLAALGAISLLGARYTLAQTGRPLDNAGQTIALRSLDGKALSLENMRGKVTVLAIGASWLPLSQREQVKIINNLQQGYGKRDVAVYFVSTDADTEKSKNYVSDDQLRGFGDKYKLVVPSLRDPASTTLKAFGLDQIPAFVVLDKQGKVAAKFSGIDVKNDLTAQISGEIDKVL